MEKYSENMENSWDETKKEVLHDLQVEPSKLVADEFLSAEDRKKFISLREFFMTLNERIKDLRQFVNNETVGDILQEMVELFKKAKDTRSKHNK